MAQNGRNDQLTSAERVSLALAGHETDRPPVSLWKHFPEQDQTSADLSAITGEWQDAYGFDFIKFMPPGDYATIDWGAESVYEGARGGTRTTTTFPVVALDDWAKIVPIDVTNGFNGMILDAVTETVALLEQQTPLFQTVFSPLTVAMKLSNGRVQDHLKEDPARVHEALAVITAVTIDMLTHSVDRGAQGVFFASQCADRPIMSKEAYREFGLSYDLRVLEALDGAKLILHLHGDDPMLELESEYPAGFLNWHDRRMGPPLLEIHERTGRPVVGGIDEKAVVEFTAEEAGRQADDAINSMSGRALAVAPGCVVPIDTPEANVRAIVETVKGQV